jgi:hypothetical protein
MRILKNLSIFSIIVLIASLVVISSDGFAEERSSISTTVSNTSIKSPQDPHPEKGVTTSSPETPTATTKTEECLVSLIFEGNQRQQTILRNFRDEILARHDKGIEYIKRYYLHSPEITLILLADDDIRIRAHVLFTKMVTVASALLETGGAQLSEHVLDDADKVLNDIAHKASPSLRETIKMAKSDIIKKEIFEELNIKIAK